MKKGFTLIELLAVIVILAIIALIATPIVLNIISNTKENAQLRSAEMYLDAVEQSVMMKKMQETTFNPNICEIKDKELYCNDSEEELKVEVDGEKPDSGELTFTEGKIDEVTLTYSNGKTVVKENNKLVYGKKEKTFADICTYDSTSTVEEKTAGAKYKCKVKEQMETKYKDGYTFYVLTTPKEGETTINLIMDRNICEDGTLTDASKEDKCLVAWQTSAANADGPVTAMDYLYNATKDWTNISNIEMNYTDEGNTGDYGYGTIVTTDNITKITKKDGTAVTVLTNQEGYSNLKARLPYKSEVSAYDSTNKTNAYLYDYLNQSGTIQTNAISGIYGYWTLSSDADDSFGAWFVTCTGSVVNGYGVYYDNYYGVRAVINLKI